MKIAILLLFLSRGVAKRNSPLEKKKEAFEEVFACRNIFLCDLFIVIAKYCVLLQTVSSLVQKAAVISKPELGYLVEEYNLLRRRLIEFPLSKISHAIR